MTHNARVVASPCMKGKRIHMKHERWTETTDDLPADAVGDAITRAVQSAWKSGIDPCNPDFSVKVTFEKIP